MRTAPETAALVRIIESTRNDLERERAIQNLAERGDSDAARALIQVFERATWRGTKTSVLRALGTLNQPRGTEFLLRTAADREDLTFVAEALIALGGTESPIAGEFLLTVLRDREHPLRREAIIALAHLEFYSCEEELKTVVHAAGAHDAPAPLVQYAVLALGSRGEADAWPLIAAHLEATPQETTSAVQNAILLAAGEIGDDSAAARLSALDTRYRFFAHQLKSAAIERIQLRLTHGLEDTLADLLEAHDPACRRAALRALRRFPAETAWEAFTLLGSDAPVELSCRVRMALFSPHRVEEDRAFLVAGWETLSPDAAAGLIRLHATSDSDFTRRLLAELPRAAAPTLFARIRDAAALERLEELVADKALPQADRVAAVNAMVAQVQMTGWSAAVKSACGERLLARLDAADQSDLAHRLIRAIGQIRCDSRRALSSLDRLMRKDPAAAPSTIFTLGLLPGEAPARILLRDLAGLAGKDAATPRIGQLLLALSKHGPLPDLDPFLRLPPETLRQNLDAVLSILGHNTIECGPALVAEALETSALHTALLATAAACRNHDSHVWSRLFVLAASDQTALAERALHAICTSGGTEEHVRLLEGLGSEDRFRPQAFKILRSLIPTAGSDLRPVVRALDRKLSARQGIFAEPELILAATHLRDQLVFALERQIAVQARADAPIRHDVDRALATRLSDFPSYSEPVKSALRNAELTHRHPEVFNEHVDKSTMVVEYVKSIDLLLQQRLGSQIFMGGGSDLVGRMQSRIVGLGLDEEGVPSRILVRDLDLGSHFSAEDFPAYKLTTLCRVILSGKILHDQQRSIDGLRAWALVLLLFGRRFKYRNTVVEPLLAMGSADNPIVCHTASRLHALQAIRNEAAHRGTMLRTAELEAIRETSFEVLTELRQVLT